jgi:hypothetical protein
MDSNADRKPSPASTMNGSMRAIISAPVPGSAISGRAGAGLQIEEPVLRGPLEHLEIIQEPICENVASPVLVEVRDTSGTKCAQLPAMVKVAND